MNRIALANCVLLMVIFVIAGNLLGVFLWGLMSLLMLRFVKGEN